MGKGQLAGLPNWLKQKLDILKDIAIPLLHQDWVENEDGLYIQTIAIKGLDKDTNPIILLSSANEQATEDELYSYACIEDIITDDESITFTASEKPPISITVIAKSTAAAGDENCIATVTGLVDRVNVLERELNDVVVALLVDNWVLDEEAGTYSQSVDIEGLSGDAAPIICAAADSELDYFVCISETIVENNKITFIADKLPEASFTAIVKGATVNEVDQVADLTEIVGRLRELENLSNYSTEEVAIGKWIDGKTLYRRVLEVKAPSTGDTYVNVIHLPEVGKVISLNGIVGNCMSLDFYTKTTDYVHTWWRDGEKSLAMAVSSGYVNYDAQIVIEYTK